MPVKLPVAENDRYWTDQPLRSMAWSVGLDSSMNLLR